jgi:hypothetical protein
MPTMVLQSHGTGAQSWKSPSVSSRSSSPAHASQARWCVHRLRPPHLPSPLLQDRPQARRPGSPCGSADRDRCLTERHSIQSAGAILKRSPTRSGSSSMRRAPCPISPTATAPTMWRVRSWWISCTLRRSAGRRSRPAPGVPSAFLESAFADDTGRVRNFRGSAGVVADERFRSLAISLFQRGLSGAAKLKYLRPQAAALIGCDAAVRSGLGGATEATYRRLAATLWHGVESGTARSVAVAGGPVDV